MRVLTSRGALHTPGELPEVDPGRPRESRPRERHAQRIAGFSLLEIMVVVAILGTIAAITVPRYHSALRTARIRKAQQELVTMSHAIDSYRASNGGNLPLTLYVVGFGGRLDPWGVPYCYLNYADGTGDGLQWAVEAGLVDPAALTGSGSVPEPEPEPEPEPPPAPGGGGKGKGKGKGAGGGGGGGGGGGATPAAADAGGAVKIGPIVSAVARNLTGAEVADLVRSLKGAKATAMADSSVYVAVPTATVRRRDRYLFPLNTDYDLFSLGPNCRTAVAIGSTLGNDDVIRANDGGFFGLASDY